MLSMVLFENFYFDKIQLNLSSSTKVCAIKSHVKYVNYKASTPNNMKQAASPKWIAKKATSKKPAWDKGRKGVLVFLIVY